MASRLKVTEDNTFKALVALRNLIGKRVLVGIPESKANRPGSPMNNATIGFITEFGSPSANIPARAFLIPGVKKAQKACVVQLRKALEAALAGNESGATQALNAAGVIASNSVIAQISSNIPPPLSPSTIRGRRYARQTQSRRTAEDQYMDLVKGGMAPASAQSEAGIRSLVNTGALRNSITYVVTKTKSSKRS